MVIEKQSLGSHNEAETIARRAEKTVPAYRQFLQRNGYHTAQAFEERPLADKKNYVTAYRFEELLGDDYEHTFTIIRSSGSSGQTFYWPQLKENFLSSAAALRNFLEASFHIHKKRTLAIVGLALGSWIGGEQLSWVLKNIALDTPYPFSVFSPGNRHDEIIDIVCSGSKFVDQFLLCLCPSAISHIQLKARQLGKTIPWSKLRYLVLGEPFPEEFRDSLKGQANVEPLENLMLSVYGSADTGTLGFESLVSSAVRKILHDKPSFSASLGIGFPIPHFFHLCDPSSYLESVNGELCVTKWQGIPLVRYNLHDQVALLDWENVRASFLSSDAPSHPLSEVIGNAREDLPDLLAVTGRSDNCLILCGTNFTELMLHSAVKSSELDEYLTGAYQADIIYENHRQYLRFNLELKQGIQDSPEVTDEIYKRLIQALCRVQPEFHEDWKNIYSIWDNDPEHRILRINGIPWPALSQKTEEEIKQRGIVQGG